MLTKDPADQRKVGISVNHSVFSQSEPLNCVFKLMVDPIFKDLECVPFVRNHTSLPPRNILQSWTVNQVQQLGTQDSGKIVKFHTDYGTEDQSQDVGSDRIKLSAQEANIAFSHYRVLIYGKD